MQKSLKQDIYHELKRRILSGEDAPNEVLTERSIASEFEVSKTPVRESLGLLCQDGDLVRYPGMGYLVKDLSYAEAMYIAELRGIIEVSAMELVVSRATDEELNSLFAVIESDEGSESIGSGKNTTFHWELAKLTKNPYLADEVHRLALSAMRPSSTPIDTRSDEESYKRIVNALLERDVELAKEYMRQDIAFKGMKYPEK